MTSVVDLDAVGPRLKSAREARGLTLDQVAELSGLSKAHLSRLESGERQASIGALVDLAAALSVRVSTILGEDGAGPELATFPVDVPRHSAGGLEIAVCSGFLNSGSIEALRVRVKPNRPGGVPAQHRGEEWLYVLSGTLQLEYDDVKYSIPAHTAVHFNAARPHRMTSRVVTEVLLVAATDQTDLARIRH
ncbi:helix-turn-helix domain-containing protein [Mycolicibacterium stellerae]|uniref:helix-turn-helix domain-containing protein n=1 Tax=Mycolicibacterium stellerae TaxID=2358193 RepID=UPI000F0BAA63|nr:XRE family transcriptional regulator [Mycolicibacterium stellerae]